MLTVPQRIDNGICSGSLGSRPGKGRTDPSQRDIVRAEHATDHQKERKVSRSRGRGSHSDDKAACEDECDTSARPLGRSRDCYPSCSPDHSKQDRRQEMETPLGFTVRSEGNDKCEYRGKEVWRRRQEQRVDLGHAKGRDHGRDELSDSPSGGLGDDDERQQIELVIGGSGSETLKQ
jgi:hypothetical protein